MSGKSIIITTDSELNIIHEEIENAAILSGSFNPVHSGHINLLDYCFNKLNKNKPVAMFCTGGIRCEKTSVYLKKKGFKNIYQLNG